ncbi:uncharacterized protein [Blastocystis hominis]|uniref:Uncharacterized protein n=1 Tax=Blastocystis hominis TaxID=12968 RepID=D8M3X6_BLAHO|nr:uncharacterized protein [Blastocystis hominis]CBK22599.2 unnamed protein product [Blastocystis hominis]|eukprot:XP_012896647.1 uncharacterized protein [Blastocystis hominis]
MENSDKSKSFHILNCESLESIQIGRYSFGDFGGEFELKNLPQLQSIQIGTIGSSSSNFYGSSFVIRDLPNLQSITLGKWAFAVSVTTIIENLPSLQKIELSYCALRGRDDDDSCSLTLRNLPNLTSITSKDWSFQYPRVVTLASISEY